MRQLVLLVFIVVCNSFFVFSNENELNIELDKPIPGLDEESVISVYRDSKGFLWIGTYAGLYRTDGTDNQVFINNPDNIHSISSSVVYTIFEDSKGRLWLGTQKGLDQFDYETGKFIHHIPFAENYQWNYIEVRDIAEDDKGNFWIATYNHHGLIKYQAETGSAQTLWIPGYEEHRLNTLEINNDKLWIGTELAGLYCYDLKNDIFTNIINDVNGTPLTINDIKIINDTLWIGTWNHGLVSYNTKSKEITWHHKETRYANHFSGNNIRQIAVDNSNNLWLALYGNGINMFDITNKSVRVVTDKRKAPAISENILSWCIFIDQEDILWSGSMGTGLVRIFINAYKYDYLKCTDNYSEKSIINVNAVVEDQSKHLWIGTEQGLIKYNTILKKGEKVHLSPSSNEEPQIIALMIDSLQQLWVSTNIGFYIINPSTHSVISYLSLANSFLKELVNPPNLLYCDRDGDIWISAWQAGLSRIPKEQLLKRKPENYIPERYLTNQSDNSSIVNNNVVNIYHATDGTLWVGGAYFIQKFSKKTLKFEIHSWYDGSGFVEDNNQQLWITNNSHGLLVYNPQLKTEVRLGDGRSELAKISGIFKDDKYIWINRKNELVKINPKNHRVKFYKKNAGIKSTQANNVGLLLSDHRFFLGGNFGCYIFDPTEVYKSSIPEVYPTNVYIYNNKVGINDTINGTVILHRNLKDQKKIEIPARIKSFSIELSSENFIEPEKAIYAYKLLGFDTTWTLLKHPNRLASFTNLDGGDYILNMVSINPFTSSKEKIQTLSIKVKEPFYKKKWIQFFFVLTIIFLVISIILFRQYRLRKINFELEKTIRFRTQELLESNRELVESNLTKEKFLSIIAHDLKSPFNTILGFLELLHEGYDSYSDLDRKKMLHNAYNSSQVVFELVETLLFWARSKKGEMNFKPATLHVNELIHKNVKIASISSHAKSIEITFDSNDADLQVIADEDMLNFILRNLLSNSIKFTPNKGSVIIKAHADGDQAIFSVTDTGVGMSKAKLEKLFLDDSIISQPGTNNEKGTGLGLITCKYFIDKHSGKIWAESTENKGTSIYFSLPAK